jgi:diguanylate cyclase (GGDEF)-like protein
VQRIVLDQFRPRRGPDGTLFYDAIARDITERRRLEGELRRSMAEMQQAHTELDSAHRAAELRARTDELTGAFNRRHFAEIVGAALADGGSGCGLLLLDADRFKQVNDVHGHVVGDAVLVELAQRLTSSLRAGECVARWGGEEFAVLLTGVASDHDLRRRAEALRCSVGDTPMAAADVTIALTVSIGAARSVAGLGDLDSLIEAADRCLYAAKGQGRDRVCLVGELGVIEAEAREPEAVALARGLMFATGLRASFIELHAEQVAALSTAIAERLGLTAGMVLRCRLGGWLHDVGKVAIPHAILDKPGPLDAAEWAIMRTHPLHSEAIVHRIGALSEAAPAVRHHHERYDGGGYPDGLAGDAIPIEARVVAAADAYSAMTTDRVYATARSPRVAADELRRSAGTHLDPAVVGALLATLGLDAPSVPQIA